MTTHPQDREEITTKLREFIKKYDWKGLAETWQKADVKWHAEEWKQFITEIEASAEARVRKDIEFKLSWLMPVADFRYCVDEATGSAYDAGFKKALLDVSSLLSLDKEKE